MKFTDFDKTGVYKDLQKIASSFRKFDFASQLSASRVEKCLSPMAAGFSYSWAAKPVDDGVLKLLQNLADGQQLVVKYRALLDGEPMNTGENRKVLHHLLRGTGGKSHTGKAIVEGDRDIGEFYRKELDRAAAFAEAVHGGAVRGSTGRSFRTAVQIGIGGSDLGPRAMYLALEQWAAKEGKQKMKALFISNVDPDDASAVCASLSLEETLFILVSKSGTTQETLANELFVRQKLVQAGLDPAKHIVVVTSETSPLARNPAYLDSFYIDDYIGGRYSSSSAVGGVILSRAFGPGGFGEFLAGAGESDRLALEENVPKNAALLDALIGVWERNFLMYPYTAVLPYSQALSRFPAHLQQLDMESNGKRVNRNGQVIAYATGPVVFGEPGTNGQHSFYQLLHQGTDIVPLQFIGFSDSQRGDDMEVDGSSSQKKLKANLAAQIVAFAKGKADENRNKEFPGGRPSSLIFGARLDPRSLGALLAHYENKVMFQGFVWNINSFDQEGVQLGKILTKRVLASQFGDPALGAFATMLGL
jgi:glucose-6-phosphate isomerase